MPLLLYRKDALVVVWAAWKSNKKVLALCLMYRTTGLLNKWACLTWPSWAQMSWQTAKS